MWLQHYSWPIISDSLGRALGAQVMWFKAISKVLVLVLVPVLVLMVASVLFLVLVPVLFLVLALVLV